jgi:hypothetical protein
MAVFFNKIVGFLKQLITFALYKNEVNFYMVHQIIRNKPLKIVHLTMLPNIHVKF